MSTIPQDNGNGPKKNDILFHPTNTYVAMRYIETEQFENKRYIRYYSKSKDSSVPDKAHIYYHCCQTDGSGKVCGEPDPRIEASDSKTKICEKVRHDCIYVFPLVNNGQRRILLEDRALVLRHQQLELFRGKHVVVCIDSGKTNGDKLTFATISSSEVSLPPLLFFCFNGPLERISFLKFGVDISRILNEHGIIWIGTVTDNLRHQRESYDLTYKNNISHHMDLSIQPVGVPCACHSLCRCYTSEIRPKGRLYSFAVALRSLLSKIEKENKIIDYKIKRQVTDRLERDDSLVGIVRPRMIDILSCSLHNINQYNQKILRK
ncbi:MAG: hypothetical protein EZS28_020498 [Streblomastix strix]|uniref:Uncharacterized protein n=1 Tax=Streblomastix strix TaxID=222440 RepID=A0A5J4VNL4_9EUKA|nr:MAG: hypothetical protein EZS28_020498 [Streblomastix strix]